MTQGRRPGPGRDDPYDTLRRRWTDLTLGTGYDPAAEPYASQPAAGKRARALRTPWTPLPGPSGPSPLRPSLRHHRHLRPHVDPDPRLVCLTGLGASWGTRPGRPLGGRHHRTPWPTTVPGRASPYRPRSHRRCLPAGRRRREGSPPPARLMCCCARQGRTVIPGVSEPTRTGEPVEIEWDHPVREVLKASGSVEILATGPRLRPRVTPGEACVTHTCEAALS